MVGEDDKLFRHGIQMSKILPHPTTHIPPPYSHSLPTHILPPYRHESFVRKETSPSTFELVSIRALYCVALLEGQSSNMVSYNAPTPNFPPPYCIFPYNS